VGDGEFEGKFLAWLGGVSDHPHVWPAIADAPHPYQGLCLLIVAAMMIGRRINVEEALSR
jgi:hypothetical protein